MMPLDTKTQAADRHDAIRASSVEEVKVRGHKDIPPGAVTHANHAAAKIRIAIEYGFDKSPTAIY